MKTKPMVWNMSQLPKLSKQKQSLLSDRTVPDGTTTLSVHKKLPQRVPCRPFGRSICFELSPFLVRRTIQRTSCTKFQFNHEKLECEQQETVVVQVVRRSPKALKVTFWTQRKLLPGTRLVVTWSPCQLV